MPGTAEDEAKTEVFLSDMGAAIKRFHEETRQPHLGAWVHATALPLLPVLLGAILIGLVPTPDVDPARPTPVANATTPPPTPTDLALATYGIDLRLALAVLLLVVVLVVSFLSQKHLLETHAGAFWPRASRGSVGAMGRGSPATPPLRVGLWLAIGFVLGGLAITQVDRVFPWMSPPPLPSGMNGFSDMPPETFWPLALGSALIAMVFTVTALSAYAIRITWHNYPAVRHATDLAAAIDAAIARRESVDGSERVMDRAKPQKLEKQLDAILQAWNQRPLGSGVVPVQTTMKPSAIVDILKTFVRPLVAVLILGLVTLSLLFDHLEARNVWSASVIATHDFWLIVFGILCSTVVAAIYLPAMSRLSLYLEAEELLKSTAGGAPKGWRIDRGKEDEAGQRLIVPRTSTGPDDFPEALCLYLGGDRTKVGIMLEIWHFAGGFHILLKQSLTKQLVTVLGLLGPTLAGTILGLL